MQRWEARSPDVLTLPSGRLIRGRGLADPLPSGERPDFGVYLQGRRPPATSWPSVWVRWRDFGLPADAGTARDAFVDALCRAETQRVEIACTGGTGRTGTALACIAVLDGLPPMDAVVFVRSHYRPRAVETRAQRAFVESFS